MAKPICVIYFPYTFVGGGTKTEWIYEYMRFLNGDVDKNDRYVNSDQFKDYHWFCFYKSDIDEPEFKVFHEKDFTEIQFEELKKLVIESLDKSNKQNEHL